LMRTIRRVIDWPTVLVSAVVSWVVKAILDRVFTKRNMRLVYGYTPAFVCSAAFLPYLILRSTEIVLNILSYVRVIRTERRYLLLRSTDSTPSEYLRRLERQKLYLLRSVDFYTPDLLCCQNPSGVSLDAA